MAWLGHLSAASRIPLARRTKAWGKLRELTVDCNSSPRLNRHEKRDKDAAEWLPPLNRCWFVRTIIRIKRRYGLTVDRRERDALATVFGQCQ